MISAYRASSLAVCKGAHDNANFKRERLHIIVNMQFEFMVMLFFFRSLALLLPLFYYSLNFIVKEKNKYLHSVQYTVYINRYVF